MTRATRRITLATILAITTVGGLAHAQRGGPQRGGAPRGGPQRGGPQRGGMVGAHGGNPGHAPVNFNRPAFGGINTANRPNNMVGPHSPAGNHQARIGGDHLGVVNRANVGINATNRNQIGNQANFGNRTNVGVNATNRNNTFVNRPTNINVNNNVKDIKQNNINNVTNINNITTFNRGHYGSGSRPGYNDGGGYRPGYGYGGGYRPGYGSGGAYRPGYGYGGWNGGWSGGGWSRPNPYVGYHKSWVNGYWNGNYHSGSWNNWGTTALGAGVGLGVAAWGVGSLLNTWGYSSYANPYYSSSLYGAQQPAVVVAQPQPQPQPAVYDYSRPLDLTSQPPPQAVVDQSVASFDSARSVFRTGDYRQALTLADQAIKETPNDPILHEFRAICLFAMGRYDEAAVPLYTVLSAGPGWDWTTLVGLYPSIDVYTQQLRALEAFIAATPRAAAARFVLAALYMTQGDKASATTMLTQVVALQPQDKLSAQLLEALTPKPAEAELAQASPSPSPSPTQPATPPAEAQPPANPELALPTSPVPAKLVGTWTASPVKDVAITLTLDDAKGFAWKVTDHGQSREFKGTATFDDDTLAFATPDDQPPMVGKVAWKDGGQFQFLALGAPADDPGLNFKK